MRNEDEEKRAILLSMMVFSVSFFAYKKHVALSRHVSLRRRLSVDDVVRQNFVYTNRSSNLQSRIGYAFNHKNLIHLSSNMMLMYLFGRDLVEDKRVSWKQFGGMAIGSALAATVAHRTPVPMIGASGIVMGLLGELALLDPNKTWMLVLPIPGVPVTNMQLAQGVLVSHLVAIGLKLRMAARYALMGHVGGLLTGGACVVAANQAEIQKQGVSITESLIAWRKTFHCTGLVLYWFFLSARIPLTSGPLKGELLTKQRLIERSLDDQY
jgi:membrane associated rhomboid family serine protease